jgi:hypothetical protein
MILILYHRVLLLLIGALKVPVIAEILREDLVVLKTIKLWQGSLPANAIVFIKARIKCARC